MTEKTTNKTNNNMKKTKHHLPIFRLKTSVSSYYYLFFFVFVSVIIVCFFLCTILVNFYDLFILHRFVYREMVGILVFWVRLCWLLLLSLLLLLLLLLLLFTFRIVCFLPPPTPHPHTLPLHPTHRHTHTHTHTQQHLIPYLILTFDSQFRFHSTQFCAYDQNSIYIFYRFSTR